MVRADLAVFGLGALLFAAGLYGIYALPPDGEGGPLLVYTVTWRETTTDLGNLATTTFVEGDPEPQDVPFEITRGNFTEIVLSFACTDRFPTAAAPQNVASITVEVQGPANSTEGNLTGSGQGPCGEPVEVRVRIQPDPTTATAAGRSEQEARDQLLAGRATESGVGQWVARVTFSRPTPIPQLPGAPAGGGDLAITGAGEHHEPTLTAQPR